MTAILTTFTQAQLAAGLVTFVHNGTDTAQGTFKVSVSDGLAASAAMTVTVAVPTVRFLVLTPDGFDFNDGEPIEQMGAGVIQPGATATQFTIVNADANRRFVFEGTGFDVVYESVPPDVAGGTITRIRVFTDDPIPVELFDLIGNIDAELWYDAVVEAADGDSARSRR